jgi:hypothetical protein
MAIPVKQMFSDTKFMQLGVVEKQAAKRYAVGFFCVIIPRSFHNNHRGKKNGRKS